MKARKIIFTAIFALALAQCFSQSGLSDERQNNFYYLKKLNSVFEFVQQNYVDEIDPKVLYEGAMKGLMGAFNDPYTSYLDTSTIRDLSDTTSGKFGGVGLTITKPTENTLEKPAYVEVASPIEGSPGSQAGIQSGDLLIEIDGTDTSTISMDDVLLALRGEVGTDVKVKVLRGKGMTFEVTLTRALIEVPTVKFGMVGESKKRIAYMRLIQFTPETPIRTQAALDSFEASDYEALILDLRDNPGGLITSAVDVADKFIDEGPIVSTKSRLSYENMGYNARSDRSTVRNVPIVVLINRGSASASEILSGALKDNHKAYLIGKNTYGKGSVQQVIPLGKSEEIKLTMARYYTPSDTNIDKIGIPPDLDVGYADLTESNEKAYVDLVKSNAIDDYCEQHPKMSEEQIARYAKELSKDYDLDVRLLRRLIRIKNNRAASATVLYDWDYDIQLQKAVEILDENTQESFVTLLRSTKTLKELQQERLDKEAADGLAKGSAN